MKTSLRNKVVIMMTLSAVVLAAVAGIVSQRVIGNMVDSMYQERGNELAATIAEVLDGDEVKVLRDNVLAIYLAADERVGMEEWGSDAFNAYLDRFKEIKQTAEYKDLLQQLRGIQEVNSVDCIYLADVDPVYENFIYLVDAALEDACDPGVIDPLYEENAILLSDRSVGFPSYITNTEEYGWLETAGAPVYDSKGEVVAYAMVDITMEEIRGQQRSFTYLLMGILAVLTVLIAYLSIRYVNNSIVKPINVLSKTAEEFRTYNSKDSASFAKLNINTRDEIESLHKSMINMEHDIDEYINNLIRTRAELDDTKEEADRMNELAHKDALTGLHNVMAYRNEIEKLDEDIRNGKKDFGIAMIDLNNLKYINDTFGHDYGNIYLQIISQLICDTFAHSPVYRIGGDEFAVILKNRDYKNIDKLIQQFNDALLNQDRENKEPWEVPTAAIGYAAFDEEKDKCADDVFQRADQMMYENKKAMKQTLGQADYR